MRETVNHHNKLLFVNFSRSEHSVAHDNVQWRRSSANIRVAQNLSFKPTFKGSLHNLHAITMC